MLHVEPKYKKIVLSIIYPYIQYDIRAYGSRVKGTQRTFSDLDLCIMKPIPHDKYHAIVAAFEESNLPFFVSIAEWSTLNESFKTTIKNDLIPSTAW